jgi:hypothetical protein
LRVRPAIAPTGLAFLLAVAGCGPTPISGYELTGPHLIQPGESVTYALIEPRGASRAVPGVRWSSSAPDVLAIDSAGVATGRVAGEATLTAEIDGGHLNLPVLVLPAGTFKLTGRVTESGSSTQVSGARVAAYSDMNGSLPPVVETTSGPLGFYVLYGVPAQSFIRVTQGGYFTTVDRVDLVAHGVRDFSIAWDIGTLNLTGSYTLTIEADANCAAESRPLAASLRRRSFGAAIQQTGSLLVVSVGSPCVANDLDLSGGCQFLGRSSVNGATFSMTTGGPFAYPDLVEGLPLSFGFPQHGLLFLGTATTSTFGDRLSGSMVGEISHNSQAFPTPRTVTASCRAGTFELVRR